MRKIAIFQQSLFAVVWFAACTSASTVVLAAESQWQLGLGLGGSLSMSEDLTVKQAGKPDIQLNDADFSTKPFSNPLYYAVRLSRWQDYSEFGKAAAWEFELIHHKIYIDDLPSDVQHFEITDGYNLLYINRAWLLDEPAVTLRAGAGAVVAHPQITVRDKTNYKVGGGAIPMIWDTDSGYQWAGWAVQASAEKAFALSDRWTLAIEGKLTHAQAEIDIADGKVDVPNTAVHGLVWLKYSF